MKKIKILSMIFFILVISLTMSTVVFAADTTDMVDMHIMASDSVETREELTDSYGNSYSYNIFAFDARKYAYVRYELKGEYKSFTGNLVASESTASSANMMFSVYADGKEVYTISNFTKQMDAQSISIDLTGVNVLEFMSRDATEAWDAWEFITDGEFTVAENAALTYPDWKTLNDVVLVDSGNYSASNRMQVDSYGELYHDGYSFDSRRNAYALYNLNKEYESFTGYIWPQRNANDNMSSTIKIYADDKEVYKKSGIKNTTQAVRVELNVSGVKTLRIESFPEGDSQWDTTIYFGGTKLSKHQHIAGEPTIDKEATCTEAGTQSVYCTECKALIGSESIDPKGHTPDGKWEYANDGTCNKIQHCTICKEQATRQTDKEAEHTLSGEWVVEKEAKCDSEGKRVQYCTICKKIGSTETIEKTTHDFGSWSTISGSIWNNPIIKERECSICGEVERNESNATSWVKPLVIVLLIIIFGSIAVIFVTLKMNGLPLEPASIKKLFSKETLSDTDIENLLNKTDDNNSKE